VNGRKRHILVDTLGLLLRVVVRPADVPDPAAVPAVLDSAAAFPRVEKVWVDMAYQGSAKAWIEEHLGWTVTIVQRPRRYVRVPAGTPLAVIARTGQIGRSTLKRYLRQERTTGDLTPRRPPGRTPLIRPTDYPALAAQLAAFPAATLAEHAASWERASHPPQPLDDRSCDRTARLRPGAASMT
jgi:transposase